MALRVTLDCDLPPDDRAHWVDGQEWIILSTWPGMLGSVKAVLALLLVAVSPWPVGFASAWSSPAQASPLPAAPCKAAREATG